MATGHLICSHNYALVALSVLIAMFASYAALDLAGRVTAAGGWIRAVWLLGGAGAMGTGIWSMHYIGMLACILPVPVAYHWSTVLLSLFAAILASAIALYVVSRQKMSAFQAFAGSVLMGGGIASMHYIGMAAMRLPAICHYNSLLVVLSVVFAVLISLAALWITFHFRDEKAATGWRKITGAVVMGAAIPVMHYTGMAAASFTPSGIPADLSHAISISTLGTAGIAAATLIVLGLALLTSWVDRRFAAQTLELQEEKLHQSEAYLSEAQQLSHTGSFGWRISSGEITWSEETFRIFQYDRTTKPTVELLLQRVHPEDAALVKQTIEHASQDGKDFDFEHRLLMLDGSVKHLDVVAHAERDKSGELEFVGAVMDITERKQAEEKLRRSKAFLAEGQRISHTGSWSWDVSSGKVAWSEEHFRIFGFDPEKAEPSFQLFLETVHPEDRSFIERSLDEAVRKRSGFDIEFRIALADGSIKHVQGVGRPVVEESGEVDRYTGTTVDISERKRGEALFTGEKRLLEMIATGVALKEILNVLCLIIEEYRSGTLASVLLLRSDGLHLDSVAGPSLPKAWTQQMENLPIGPCAGSCGTAAYRGSPVIVSDIATDPLWEVPEHRTAALSHGLRASWSNPILSSGGKVLGTFCIYERETRNPNPSDLELIEKATYLARVAIERDRAEAALRTSQEKYRDLINASPDAICVIDADGKCVLVNPAGVELAGRPEDELIGTSIANTYLPEERHLLANRLEKLKAEGSFRFERKFLRGNGELIPVEVSLSALRGRHYQAIIRDISQRKRREALLAGENRLLEMVAKGDSLAAILDSLCLLVEEQSSGVLASILLMDPNGKQLRHGGAPNLPKAYTEAIDGTFIGPSVGSCGTAAYRAEQVIVSDIATDPLWADFRDLALAHSLRACWSTPIFSSENKVIGTFAMYYREPRSPSPREQDTIKHITHLAGIAIQRKLAEAARRESEAYLAEAQRLSHTGSWAWAPATGEIRYWSEETYRVLGFDPDAGPPRFETFFQRLCSEDQVRVRELFEKAVREKADFETDYRIVHPDGAIKHIHGVGHPVCDETGHFVEFVGSVIDVTETKRAEEALRASEQVARGQVEALAQSLDVLATAPDPEKFIGQMLSTIGRLLNSQSVSLWLFDDSSDSLILRSMADGGKLAALDAEHPFVKDPLFWKQNPAIQELLFTAGPVVCEDVETDPRVNGEWRDYLKRNGTKRFMAVPILVAGQVRGFVGIRHTDRASYRPEEIELTQALAHQVMLAIQLNEFAEQGQRAAVFEERNRMARDIHDTLAQGFTGVIVQLEAAEDAISCGYRKEADNHLHRAGELARQSLSEARRSVHALRPRALQEHNFWDALKGVIRNTTVGTALHTKFAAQGKLPELPQAWQENLLHIGQEALTNTLKYAHARNFETRLSYKARELRLELRDDGDGFKAKDRHDGVGLTGMRERVEQMGGELKIASSRGKGTKVTVLLPCNGESTL
jgi:PAS domain S-box-containing protein